MWLSTGRNLSYLELFYTHRAERTETVPAEII
jgi:hypothetical protein